MNYFLICVVLLTIIFGGAAIYFVVFIHSARKTLSELDTSLEAIRDTAERAEQLAIEAQASLTVINEKLPGTMTDLAVSAANIRAASASAKTLLDDGKKPESKKLPGTSIIKGYSIWNRFKRKRH